MVCCTDPSGVLRTIEETRALFPLTCFGVRWLATEAYANLSLENLSRAHELGQRLREQLILIGMENSNHLLCFYDIQQDIHLAKTEYLEAKKICECALATQAVTYSPRFYAHFLVHNAYNGIHLGSIKGEILSNLEAAEAVYKAIADPRILLCSWVRAELELSQGNHSIANFAFKECLSRSLRSLDFWDITVCCLATLADIPYKMDTAWNSLRWAITYFSAVRKSKMVVATFHALRCLADIFVAFQDEHTALNLFYMTLSGATKLGIHRLQAECMVGIGDIMSSRDNMVEAKEMWKAAHPLFVRSSQTKAAVAIEARLEKLSLSI